MFFHQNVVHVISKKLVCNRWEEAATSQGEDHHPQYNVQKEELRNNSCQMDRSIEHRLQSNRNLEDSNMLGIDIRRRSRQDIHELDTVLERSKGTRDNITYGECQKNQSADRGMTSVDGCGQFLSSGFDSICFYSTSMIFSKRFKLINLS